MIRKLFKASYIEPIIIFGMALIIYLIGAEHDVFEMLVDFMEDHEDWELDEVFLAVVVMGCAGYVYAYRRQAERRKEVEKRLRVESNLDWLSKHDNLTKLPNRHYLSEFTKRLDGKNVHNSENRYGLISIDLDGFKKANDLLGHTGGDKLLIEVTRRLREIASVRMLFRLGGDEFLAITDLNKGPSSEEISEMILRAIQQPFNIDGTTNKISASLGTARYPEDAPTLTQAIHCSDLAMYKAKRSGKSKIVVFEPYMTEVNQLRSELERDLQNALQNGEIRPYYQPLVELDDGKLRGFEALARWERPGHGFVPPETFVSVAEDIGAITDLSDQILRQACLDATAWPESVILSFNLSPLQLSDLLISERILKILDETGFPADRLEVEITESALIDDIELTTNILRDLNTAGIRIALDDFGTGYSNLSQLSKLNFDRIKIDRDFIQNFSKDPKQMKIVKTILSLGEGLGIHTTAEGIEEGDQLEMLKALGCDCGQGFFLGHPVNATETLEFLRKYESRDDAA